MTERLQILEMIANGQITAEEGIKLIQALEEAQADMLDLPESAPLPQADSQPMPAEAGPAAPETPPSPEPVSEAAPEVEVTVEDQPMPEVQTVSHAVDPKLGRWRQWWQIPLWIGVIITIISGLLMFSAYEASGFGFWFACTWFPFFLGVAVLALAWISRTAPWLHLRVTQKPGEKPGKIAISFPIPLRLTAWFLRTFRGKIPKMENTNLDEVILGLGNISPDAPLYIQVDEGDDGEKVEIYIG